MGNEAGIRQLKQWVVFRLNEQRYALSARMVERIVRAVAITRLPKAPEIVLGMINVQGRIVPVVNIRRRFGWPERALELSDQFIIARTARRTIALVVDEVTGVMERAAEEIVGSKEILAAMEYTAGVLKAADGLVIIHDLDTFLSLEEATALEAAVASEAMSL